MSVQDTVVTVVVPQQAGPVEPPPAAAPALLVGRDRPLTAEERAIAVGLVAMVLVLDTIIVVGLLVAHHVWT